MVIVREGRGRSNAKLRFFCLMVNPKGSGVGPVHTIPLVHLSSSEVTCVHSGNLSIVVQPTSSEKFRGSLSHKKNVGL